MKDLFKKLGEITKPASCQTAVSGSLPDEEMIKTLSSRYMHSNRTIGGGDAGWIEAAYKDGMRDLVKMLKGNDR